MKFKNWKSTVYNISFLFCTQSFQKSWSWNAKLQCYVSSLDWFLLESRTWVISAGKCLWALERELLFPWGRVWCPGWAGQPWPCWRRGRGERMMLLLCQVILGGRGKRSWCCALYGMLGRAEGIVRKSRLRHCHGVICMGHVGAKI